MGRNRRIKEREEKEPKYKISIVKVDNSSAEAKLLSPNSYMVNDGTEGNDKGYCITFTNDEIKKKADFTTPKNKRKRVYIREILNLKSNKKRLEVSASNWLPLTEKPKTVDASTSPVREIHDDLSELVEHNTNPELKEAYPNAIFSNREEENNYTNEFESDVMEFLRNEQCLGPSPETRLTVVPGAIGPSDHDHVDLINLSLFN